MEEIILQFTYDCTLICVPSDIEKTSNLSEKNLINGYMTNLMTTIIGFI